MDSRSEEFKTRDPGSALSGIRVGVNGFICRGLTKRTDVFNDVCRVGTTVSGVRDQGG